MPGAMSGRQAAAQTSSREFDILSIMIASESVIRVVGDPPQSGLENMARDEAILDAVGRCLSPPTLRMYQWDRPTISLGYFQKYADYAALPPPAGSLPVVRRPTGGGAILHDMELTYALTLPVDHRLLAEGPGRLYACMHDAIIMALDPMAVRSRRCGVTDDSTATRGPFFCFARRHCFDLTVGDAKLAGSAQRRTRTAVLQHGSIILGSRFDQQPTARLALDPAAAIAGLRAALPHQFANLTSESLVCGEWSPEELAAVPGLIEKHAAAAWLRRM